MNEVVNKHGSIDLLVAGNRGTYKVTIDDNGAKTE